MEQSLIRSVSWLMNTDACPQMPVPFATHPFQSHSLLPACLANHPLSLFGVQFSCCVIGYCLCGDVNVSVTHLHSTWKLKVYTLNYQHNVEQVFYREVSFIFLCHYCAAGAVLEEVM